VRHFKVPLSCFTINAAGVLQVPLVISVWDDDYGISVHAKHQHQREYFRNFKRIPE
jgi:TPP-dependent pyruvate/acetoin dehydrogenase alpha subunit